MLNSLSAARVHLKSGDREVCLNSHLARISVGQVTIIKVSGQEHATLFNGDILIVDEKPLAQCRPDDHVLLYQTNGEYISVRICEIPPAVFEPRIHLVRRDDPTPAAVVGRVVAWFRGDEDQT